MVPLQRATFINPKGSRPGWKNILVPPTCSRFFSTTILPFSQRTNRTNLPTTNENSKTRTSSSPRCKNRNRSTFYESFLIFQRFNFLPAKSFVSSIFQLFYRAINFIESSATASVRTTRYSTDENYGF